MQEDEKKTKKQTNTFADIVSNVLVVKWSWWSIKRRIKFKNHFKQLAVPFKIYADFEPVLKRIQRDDASNASYTKTYQEHILCSLAYKVVCIDYRSSKPVVLYKRKNAVNKFTEAILDRYDYCKKVIKKHFNKNNFMSAEDEKSFKSNAGYAINCLLKEIQSKRSQLSNKKR